MDAKVYYRNSNIVARRIHGSFFLIDICDNYSGDRCSLYEINETGMFIWEQIDGKKSIKEIACALKDAIIDEIVFQIIEKDVSEYINSLTKLNFLNEEKQYG